MLERLLSIPERASEGVSSLSARVAARSSRRSARRAANASASGMSITRVAGVDVVKSLAPAREASSASRSAGLSSRRVVASASTSAVVERGRGSSMRLVAAAVAEVAVRSRPTATASGASSEPLQCAPRACGRGSSRKWTVRLSERSVNTAARLSRSTLALRLPSGDGCTSSCSLRGCSRECRDRDLSSCCNQLLMCGNKSYFVRNEQAQFVINVLTHTSCKWRVV